MVKNIDISLERLAILDVMILRPNTTQYTGKMIAWSPPWYIIAIVLSAMVLVVMTVDL